MRSERIDKKNSVTSIVITILPPILLIGVFAYWILTSSFPVVPSACSGALAVLIACLLIRTSAVFLDQNSTAFREDTDIGTRNKRAASSSLKHPVLAVMLIAALSRILIFIAVYAVHTAVHGYQAGILQMSSLWNPPFSQGTSAMNISNSWYAASEFPSASYLPLFPLYPLLISFVNLLTGNRFLAGLILSLLFFVLSAAALYLLVRKEYGNTEAFRAVRYLCILPPTFLLNLPAADVLFLLLSIIMLHFARRRKFYAASLTGAAAACTAFAGILLFVPVAFELLLNFREDRSVSVKAGPLAKEYVPRLLAAFLIPAGTLACAAFIERHSGTAFPWFGVFPGLPNTGLSSVFRNFAIQVQTLLQAYASGTFHDLYGYVLPNLLCLIAVPLILFLSARRIRLSYTLYGICFYLLTSGYGNLVSAPRYMILCVPVLIGLASCIRNKALDFLFSAASLFLLAGYLYAFTLQWGVF